MLYDGSELTNGFKLHFEMEKLLPEFKKMGIENLLAIFIKLFVKKYPNGFLDFFDFIGEDYGRTKIDSSHSLYQSTKIFNKDIESVKWYVVTVNDFFDVEFQQKFPGCVFIEKIEFVFKKEIAEKVITDAIGDFKFDKSIDNDIITLTLKESALSYISVENKKVTLSINPDKFFYYGT